MCSTEGLKISDRACRLPSLTVLRAPMVSEPPGQTGVIDLKDKPDVVSGFSVHSAHCLSFQRQVLPMSHGWLPSAVAVTPTALLIWVMLCIQPPPTPVIPRYGSMWLACPSLLPSPSAWCSPAPLLWAYWSRLGCLSWMMQSYSSGTHHSTPLSIGFSDPELPTPAPAKSPRQRC